ncbi:MAG TPA: hypothetical protein PLG65_02790 [Bacillota bacterium]|nr:hypothetical protein [Bacillota bacterium]
MNSAAFRERYAQGIVSRFDRRVPRARSFTVDADGFHFEVTVTGFPSLAFGYRPFDYVTVNVANLGCCLTVRAASYVSSDYVARQCNMTDAQARAFVAALVTRCPELMLRTDKGLAR